MAEMARMAKMIDTNYGDSKKYGSNGLPTWHCLSCSGVHLPTGRHLLRFNSEEVAVFTQSFVECYRSQIALRAHDDSSHHEALMQSWVQAIN